MALRLNKICFKKKLFTNINSLIFNKKLKSSESSGTNLHDVLEKNIPDERKRIEMIKKSFGDVVVDEIKLKQIFMGMRGVKGLVYDISFVDPIEGVFFRHMSPEDCQKELVKAKDSEEILPESVFWLLVTGEEPTQEQVNCLSQEWKNRATLPKFVEPMLNSMPKDIHPMAQFSAIISALSSYGQFAKKYSKGLKKKDFWIYTYEDAMDLIAKIPLLASHIFLNCFRDKKGKENIQIIEGMDWAENFSHMIGFEDEACCEMMRMFLSIHCDNESGNVSAHTVHLVGSALSDPYLSFAAGVNGLAGPLHGLANQDVLKWLNTMVEELGCEPSKEEIDKYCRDTLSSGRVIPGYGHAVLRTTDKRYLILKKFSEKYLSDDPMYKIVSTLFEVVPPILKEGGKVQNPWPNVDAHSGIVLQHFGLTEMKFYTVLFAMSRCLGTMAGLIWARALGYPIERPKSYTTDHYIKMAKEGNNKKKKC